MHVYLYLTVLSKVRIQIRPSGLIFSTLLLSPSSLQHSHPLLSPPTCQRLGLQEPSAVCPQAPSTEVRSGVSRGESDSGLLSWGACVCKGVCPRASHEGDVAEGGEGGEKGGGALQGGQGQEKEGIRSLCVYVRACVRACVRVCTCVVR